VLVMTICFAFTNKKAHIIIQTSPFMEWVRDAFRVRFVTFGFTIFFISQLLSHNLKIKESFRSILIPNCHFLSMA
jgi:hypothetical protein